MAAAQTNALISNNSWNYGVAAYDLAAASYDAAVRDALPGVTGSQPVLFVFSAGNNGGGDDSTDPGGGIPDTILSPGTAKNVITVGALQEFRDITNIVTTISADGGDEPGAGVAAADQHQLPGGGFFEPGQRGHRHWKARTAGSSRTWWRRGRLSCRPARRNGTSRRRFTSTRRTTTCTVTRTS